MLGDLASFTTTFAKLLFFFRRGAASQVVLRSVEKMIVPNDIPSLRYARSEIRNASRTRGHNHGIAVQDPVGSDGWEMGQGGGWMWGRNRPPRTHAPPQQWTRGPSVPLSRQGRRAGGGQSGAAGQGAPRQGQRLRRQRGSRPGRRGPTRIARAAHTARADSRVTTSTFGQRRSDATQNRHPKSPAVRILSRNT
jgi:hypothetical protein